MVLPPRIMAKVYHRVGGSPGSTCCDSRRTQTEGDSRARGQCSLLRCVSCGYSSPTHIFGVAQTSMDPVASGHPVRVAFGELLDRGRNLSVCAQVGATIVWAFVQ